jgi:hypothetical protein
MLVPQSTVISPFPLRRVAACRVAPGLSQSMDSVSDTMLYPIPSAWLTVSLPNFFPRNDLPAVNAINIRGSQTGIGCSYTATIKSQRPNDSTSLPPAQTSPQDANLLVSFSGLSFGPYSLSLQANCDSSSFIQVTRVEMSLWSGDSGQTVSEEDIDDISPVRVHRACITS